MKNKLTIGNFCRVLGCSALREDYDTFLDFNEDNTIKCFKACTRNKGTCCFECDSNEVKCKATDYYNSLKVDEKMLQFICLRGGLNEKSKKH